MIIANLLTDDGNPTHVFNNLDIMLFFFDGQACIFYKNLILLKKKLHSVYAIDWHDMPKNSNEYCIYFFSLIGIIRYKASTCYPTHL